MIFFCESREKKWGGFGDGRGRKPGVRGVLTIPCASPSSYRACTHAATSRAVVVSVVGSPHANQADAIPTSLFGNFQRASGDHGAGKCASATGHRRQKRAIIHARWRDDHPGPSGHAMDLTRGAVRHDVTNRAHHKWGRAQVLVFDGDEIQIPGVFSCEKWSLEFVWVFRLIGVRTFSALCRASQGRSREKSLSAISKPNFRGTSSRSATFFVVGWQRREILLFAAGLLPNGAPQPAGAGPPPGG